MEGAAPANSKARFGHSQEKRYDCKLLTLGLVIDDQGFPKRSKVMEGSVSEPSTLQQMINYLTPDGAKQPVTVILDPSIPEDSHIQVYKALNLSPNPVPRKVTKRQLI